MQTLSVSYAPAQAQQPTTRYEDCVNAAPCMNRQATECKLLEFDAPPPAQQPTAWHEHCVGAAPCIDRKAVQRKLGVFHASAQAQHATTLGKPVETVVALQRQASCWGQSKAAVSDFADLGDRNQRKYQQQTRRAKTASGDVLKKRLLQQLSVVTCRSCAFG